MKISKHVHSCLLIEEAGKNIVIDPGNYTFDENALDITVLPHLDFILITHEHADHMSIPLIRKMVGKFPSVQILSNESVKKILKKEELAVNTEGTDFITLKRTSHEDPYLLPIPQNTLFTLFNKLTVPGDSHHFTLETSILALPVQAFWGSTAEAIRLAEKLKPKIIIQIHDWQWSNDAREGLYERLEHYFKRKNIEFKKMSTGRVIQV